jgi:signal transduction histidine kinase
MMIARGEPHPAALRAVAGEAARQFAPAAACVVMCRSDGSTALAAESEPGWADRLPIGVTASALKTGRFTAAETGTGYTAATPVEVGGTVWGLVAVGAEQGGPPPDAERRLAEFAELVATAVANERRRAEHSASRARLVAASDESRRRIERDLHDGAQQFVVTAVLRLRSVAEMPSLPPEARAELEDIAAELNGVLDDLRELSRGIHPEVLSKGGLRPALRALARRSSVSVVLDLRLPDRLPEPVEVGAYYLVSEALANATKHANASTVEVAAETSGGTLRVSVHDDGIGGADMGGGSGLTGLKDRIEALGGTFAVESPRGGGTTVRCALPVHATVG